MKYLLCWKVSGLHLPVHWMHLQHRDMYNVFFAYPIRLLREYTGLLTPLTIYLPMHNSAQKGQYALLDPIGS